MADIEKFIKDMEKASEKLADMLNKKEEPIPSDKSDFSTEVEELKDIVKIGQLGESDDDNLAEVKTADISGSSCNQIEENQDTPQPCSRIVRFSCVRNIPKGVRLDRAKDFRVAYDPTNLRAYVEEAEISVTPPPGCPDLELTVYAVRVVGCIPVSISVLAFESRCGVNLVPGKARDNKVALCCNTTVCVDKIVCYRGTREQAEIAAATIQEQLRSGNHCNVQVNEPEIEKAAIYQNNDPCTAVPLLYTVGRIFRVPLIPCGDNPKILAFTGAFKLPTCPEVVSST